jgi:signal transduction histidine kinase
LAKIETGRAIVTDSVVVANFLQQLVFDHELLAQSKSMSLSATCSPSDLVAIFDPLQIRQVLNNLLANAIKYTPANGSVTITISATPTLIQFMVEDTGIGIPKDAIPHLFERFYRVDNERHRAEEGTGLGLAIVKSIVEQHGGAIRVESHVDKGSRFIFTLPIKI